MQIDFNNVRRQACIAYDKLCKKLNSNTDKDGILELDVSDIQESMDELRYALVCVASSFLPGDEDIKNVYAELYPEGKQLEVFNPEP